MSRRCPRFIRLFLVLGRTPRPRPFAPRPGPDRSSLRYRRRLVFGDGEPLLLVAEVEHALRGEPSSGTIGSSREAAWGLAGGAVRLL
jgi:hypothetical protein